MLDQRTSSTYTVVKWRFKKRVLIAATRYRGKTYVGRTHPEAYETIPGFNWDSFDFSKSEDGFVSLDGKFLTRQEASKAVNALKDELFSEDMPR